MKLLQRAVEYNAWANARVAGTCSTLDPAVLAEPAPGSIGTVEETLKHLIGVEDSYFSRLSGRDPQADTGDREAYLRQDLGWFFARWSELAAGYRDLVVREDDAALERPAVVPWIPAPLTRLDQYLQVLTHSAHHRAEAFSILGSRGLQVPDLDYVFMRQEQAR